MRPNPYSCRGEARQAVLLAFRRWSGTATLVFLLVLSASTTRAQLSVTSPQTPNECDTPYTCCLELTIEPNTTLEIDMTSFTVDPADTNCFDWACLEAQSGGNLFLDHHDESNSFSATNTGGTALNFTLCADPDCIDDNALLYLFWRKTNGNGEADIINFAACGEVPDPCLSCDYVRSWPDNTICLTRSNQNNCLATQIAFNFSPDLPECVRNSITDYDATQWDADYFPSSGTVSSITFTYNGGVTGVGGLAPCETFCFKLPSCCDVAGPPPSGCVEGLSTTITGFSTAAPNCNQPNSPCTGRSHSFKSATGTNNSGEVGNSSESNYPNPLTLSNQYKSLLPFETAFGGEAFVTIVDEAGHTVYTDRMALAQGGKHAFNFSGEQLPAGKYFYTIESPMGHTIVSRSLLIVK